VRVGDNLADRRVLLAGLGALQELVWPKIDLEVTFGMNFNHPRPLGGLFRPVPLLMPRDLLSAVWLQFCIDMADFDYEWRLCVACGRPFEVTRSDQTTCPSRPGCKKKGSGCRWLGSSATAWVGKYRPSGCFDGATLPDTTLIPPRTQCGATPCKRGLGNPHE
jgi:hypothetical protein